ncbi:predicted protein [Nematostella vectensis]|uniref:Uricase n=1 Tax=Nematostella vectensis TaxID=45351 RepID=A7SYI1_NEMVE|nr:uricase isoform X2 [Nematostella vectensis]EDO31222.1 predicted protein [Nematostella vectensis]|eukprot:XP_001623322.1 predicted protein [Nematostella vectensis]
MAPQTFFTNFTGYGKTGVRLLKIKRRSTLYHEIKELEVAVELKLRSKKDYLNGDNSDVIPTDTQKNTIYALAKKHPLDSIEEFGLHVCKYFLDTHKHVDAVVIYINEAPWQRVKQGGIGHAHAFIMTPDVQRFCEVSHVRGDEPKVFGGLRDMKVLKTTQSGFTGFLKDQYTSLPEVGDRCFCTVVYCKYNFDSLAGVDFNAVHKLVKDVIIEDFSGPAKTGEYSASVQNTMYIAENSLLEKIPQIGNIEMVMPNVHYFNVNMDAFGIKNDNEILMPVDKPSGIIKAGLSRQPKARL